MTSLVLIILGMISCVLITASFHFKEVLFALLIPVIYATYFLAVTTVPNLLGYAIPMEQAQFEEAKVIHVTQTSDLIYLLVFVKGEKEPRLISMDNTSENQKKASEISKKIKQGLVVVKKAAKGNGGEASNNNGEGDGDLNIVPIQEQTIIQKDT